MATEFSIRSQTVFDFEVLQLVRVFFLFLLWFLRARMGVVRGSFFSFLRFLFISFSFLFSSSSSSSSSSSRVDVAFLFPRRRRQRKKKFISSAPSVRPFLSENFR